MNDKRLEITLRIGDKRYPLTIIQSEEELIRKAGDAVTKKLTEYKEKYRSSNLSEQDILSMVAFRFAFANLKLREDKDVDVLIDALDKIDIDLANYLENKK